MQTSTYTKIEKSLKMYDVSVGDVRVYKRVLRHSPDVKTADQFMISEKGGYSESELRRIKYLIEYNKKTYRDKLKLKLSI